MASVLLFALLHERLPRISPGSRTITLCLPPAGAYPIGLSTKMAEYVNENVPQTVPTLPGRRSKTTLHTQMQCTCLPEMFLPYQPLGVQGDVVFYKDFQGIWGLGLSWEKLGLSI